MKDNILILIIYLLLLTFCGWGMVYIWENSILPAINQYEKDKGDNCDHSRL